MPDLAILVPTRGRPGNLRKVIEAWDFTNGWSHADLYALVDADDPELAGYRELVKNPSGPSLWLLEIPRWMPMVHKLDLAARELADRYWALGFAGDDHLPQTIGWAKRYADVLRELGTGMVYGDDGYQGAKLSTEWAMTSDVVRALGRMVPAPVEHMFCDNAVLALFTAAGAVRHLPEIRIEHMHPVAGKARTDAQYERVNSRDQMARDRAAYQLWQTTERAAHVRAVRALRAGQPEEPPVRPARTSPPTRGRTTAVNRPPRHFKRVKALTPEDIMITLADLAAQVPADQEIIELGVFHGRTALMMAWGASLGHGAHVTGIDPWDLPGNTYPAEFTESGPRRWAAHHVKTLGFSRRVSLVQGFSADVARTYAGPPVGLLYVDGDHTKEGARQDIEVWAPHLAPGATIAVDDYGNENYPGVAEAVDELVAEGVLEAVQVFHDRLAVTRLTTTPEEPGRTTAVTSEGVHPSPYPAAPGQVAEEPEPPHAPPVDTGELELTPHPDTDVSTDRMTVRAGELEDVAEGTSVDDLGTVQLRALAKARGIKLGARKDKRADMLQALRDGK
ncbi:MAG TPA: class I SAM-dependent methyltransferase [Armatimonadota bacterium]|nr:class I SAM-dependent methyltransferase [Armatimonadota bacterium]